MKAAAKSIKNNEKPGDGRVRVVSLDADVCSEDFVVDRIKALVVSGTGGYVCLATVHMIMEGHDDPAFGKIVNEADLVVTDGMPLVWMQKLQGVSEASRFRGNDLMIRLLEESEAKGMSVGFYGGKNEVVERLMARAKKEYGGLNVVYSHSPPYRAASDQEDDEIVAEINRGKPDILFVGLGCPKQEIWMANHQDRTDSVMIGVGAAFDFYAGHISEAPKWLQKLGLEWLFRLSREPKRLWRRYLILNPRFILLAILQLSGIRRFKSD